MEFLHNFFTKVCNPLWHFQNLVLQRCQWDSSGGHIKINEFKLNY